VDHLPHGLLDSLLPGPVTVVLKRGAVTTLCSLVLCSIYLKQAQALIILFICLHLGENSILETSLNPGLDSIGVRVLDLDLIRSIARGADLHLPAPT